MKINKRTTKVITYAVRFQYACATWYHCIAFKRTIYITWRCVVGVWAEEMTSTLSIAAVFYLSYRHQTSAGYFVVVAPFLLSIPWKLYKTELCRSRKFFFLAQVSVLRGFKHEAIQTCVLYTVFAFYQKFISDGVCCNIIAIMPINCV